MKTETKNNYRYYETMPDDAGFSINIYRVDVANKNIWRYIKNDEETWYHLSVGDFEYALNVFEQSFSRLTEQELFLKLL